MRTLNKSPGAQRWLKKLAPLVFLLPAGLAQAVDLETMGDLMEADLDGKLTGYAYTISDGVTGHNGAGGQALRDIDGGLPMTLSTRSYIASVTKTITAIAVLQLLDANNLPITAKVAPWLPPDWQQGPGIAQLTFSQSWPAWSSTPIPPARINAPCSRMRTTTQSSQLVPRLTRNR